MICRLLLLHDGKCLRTSLRRTGEQPITAASCIQMAVDEAETTLRRYRSSQRLPKYSKQQLL